MGGERHLYWKQERQASHTRTWQPTAQVQQVWDERDKDEEAEEPQALGRLGQGRAGASVVKEGRCPEA